MMKVASLPGAPQRAAFTLIELLVVIAIIIILAGLLLQTAGFVQEKAGRGRAEAEIKSLESALEAYKLDNGDYPKEGADGGTQSTAVLVKELAVGPITDSEKYDHRKPFEFPIKMLSAYRPNSGQRYEEVLMSPSCYLVDPFGSPYHYKYPGDKDRSGETAYDLWSKGKKNTGSDAATDTATTSKWIKNW